MSSPRQFVITAITAITIDQHEPGWECPQCGLTRGADRHDPCMGELPGVLFACCGHGQNRGYIYFENGRSIRFDHVTSFEQRSDRELEESKELKAALKERHR